MGQPSLWELTPETSSPPSVSLSLLSGLTTYADFIGDNYRAGVSGEVKNDGFEDATEVVLTLTARGKNDSYMDEVTASIGTVVATSSKGFRVLFPNLNGFEAMNIESCDYKISCSSGDVIPKVSIPLCHEGGLREKRLGKGWRVPSYCQFTSRI